MKLKWESDPKFKGKKTTYMRKRWMGKVEPLVKWIDKPCIDPEVYSFWEKLYARYLRWRIVRKLKKSGIWKKIDCMYLFDRNLKIKESAPIHKCKWLLPDSLKDINSPQN